MAETLSSEEQTPLRWRKATRWALISLLSSLAVSALIGIGIILKGDFGDTEGKLLGTTITLGLFTVLAIPGTIQLGRDRYYALAGTAVVSAILAFILMVVAIWSDGPFESEYLNKVMVTVTVVAFASNHVALLLLATSTSRVIRGISMTTFALIGFISITLIISMWTEELPEELGRLVAVLAILDVLGSLAIPMLSKLYRVSARQPVQ
jgi:hypothetical protein